MHRYRVTFQWNELFQGHKTAIIEDSTFVETEELRTQEQWTDAKQRWIDSWREHRSIPADSVITIRKIRAL